MKKEAAERWVTESVMPVTFQTKKVKSSLEMIILKQFGWSPHLIDTVFIEIDVGLLFSPARHDYNLDDVKSSNKIFFADACIRVFCHLSWPDQQYEAGASQGSASGHHL